MTRITDAEVQRPRELRFDSDRQSYDRRERKKERAERAGRDGMVVVEREERERERTAATLL